MTIREMYQAGTLVLEQSGIEEAKLDAWYLLEYVTGISRAMYYADQNRCLHPEQANRYRDCIALRKDHMPLQHITGVQEFMGYGFRVNEHVLIPRQDTETLVETAEQFLTSELKILDMCTGSGCILISLLKRGAALFGLTQINGTGADISVDALAVAKENGQRHSVEVNWIASDLFEQIKGRYDMIVSNPPYICTAVIAGLQKEVRCHDPYLALDGKEDGLYFYRRIIKESPLYLNHQGRLLFEIGHDQGNAVAELLNQQGFEDITVKKDLTGLDRVVFGVYNKSQ